MYFFERIYGKEIIQQDYDKLTICQETETRRLLLYLGLDWENECLAPQNNKRIVRTASQQQVRQRIYKGSSKDWEKYQPFLRGVFNRFKNQG